MQPTLQGLGDRRTMVGASLGRLVLRRPMAASLRGSHPLASARGVEPSTDAHCGLCTPERGTPAAVSEHEARTPLRKPGPGRLEVKDPRTRCPSAAALTLTTFAVKGAEITGLKEDWRDDDEPRWQQIIAPVNRRPRPARGGEISDA